MGQRATKTCMHQPEPKARIAAIFKQMWPTAGLDSKFQLDFRANIAKSLLAEETEEYQSTLEEEANRDHEEKLKVFEEAITKKHLPE